MTLVLHVLPHPGGGGERYVDVLAEHDPRTHRRVFLSPDARATALVAAAPRGLPALRRAVGQADLVHVHGDMAAVLAAPLLRRATWLWTTHGLHFRRREHAPGVGPAFDRGLRGVLRHADATICTSEDERRELVALAGPDGPRMPVIHNGVPATPERTPETISAARRALRIGDDAVVALFLASLEPHKGAADAVAAVAAARAGGADLVLVVAGGGSLEAQIRGQAGEGVTVLGHVDPSGPLAAADIFVLPSEREGLSLAVLEAMERGLAPVVSDGPGNPEAVGDAGVVVPVGDVTRLSGALTRLAADPHERARLGAAARERAHDLFSLERFAAETSAVYDRLLTGPGRDAGAAHA